MEDWTPPGCSTSLPSGLSSRVRAGRGQQGHPQQLLGSWVGEPYNSAMASTSDLARKPCQFTFTQNEPLQNEDSPTSRL